MKWEKYTVQGISEGMGRSLLREGTKYKDHGYKRSKQGTVDEKRDGRKACGTKAQETEYDFLEGIWKKHNRTSLFQFYFKTTITSGSQVSTPLELKLALQVFHSFRLCYCVVL